MADIHKAAAIIIKDKKLLVERSYGKDFFIAPGGSVEPGETESEACVRELYEEFTIKVVEEDLEEWGSFEAPAAGQEDRIVKMKVFMVKGYEGDPAASSEVEEIAWVTSANEKGLKLGSIFEHEVIPHLKEQGLID